MCGVIGILIKDRTLEPSLGSMLVPMIESLGDRGPDSSGIAVYADGDPFHGQAPSGAVPRQWAGGDHVTRVSLGSDADLDWDEVGTELQARFGSALDMTLFESGAVLRWSGTCDVLDALGSRWPEVRVLGVGRALSVVKDTGRPELTCRRYGIGEWQGYLAVAHTRMATESQVTVLHSHPFVPAPDLCVVHNGSFSNYASVRRRLLDDGVVFDSDNDSEVAARFLAGRLAAGDDLEEATRWVMKEMDGFFTLVISHRRRHVGGPRRLCLQTRRRGRDRVLCGRGVGVPRPGRAAWRRRRRGLRAPARGGLHVDTLSCEELGTRGVNQRLASLEAPAAVQVTQPRGRHNLAVGLTAEISIKVKGNAGYFLGGLGGDGHGRGPHIDVDGFVGWSVGENLMGGVIRVRGSASQSAGSSARGGLIMIEGNASLRAGISLKGGTIAIAGDAGAMSGFMAQAGTILIGGDAGHGLGDSVYEAVIYVGGNVASLGADAVVEEMTDDDVLEVKRLVERTGFDHIDPDRVIKVASARQLYHFATHNHSAY